MSRRTVPVYDNAARSVLFHVTRNGALEMIGRSEAFVLLSDPLQVALTRKPTPKETNGKPDRSLVVPPSVMLAAADGSLACRTIIDSYEANHRGNAR